MRVAVPQVLTERIAARAVQRARENMARRGWSHRSQNAIHPLAEDGRVGITTSVKHLHYQNRGIRPFLMTALEGKTVPIKGQLFHVKGVGLPGWGYQDRRYDPVKGRVWRDARWRHPGIAPQRFLENSISRAILESRPKLRQQLINVLSGRDIDHAD